MRFFQFVASGAALIAAALALEINTFPAQGVEAGKTYTVTYSPASDIPTTFILRKGLSTDLGTVGTLTSTATGGSFTWTVADNLVDGSDYALEIRQAGQTPNYSAQFGLTGGETASASASASASMSSVISSVASSVRASASASASASSASASSVSASLSSLISSVASSAAASATISSSAGLNSTVSTATLSRSTTGTHKPTGSASSTSVGPPESTGAASMLGSSPLALLFGAVGALAFLN